MKRFWIAPNGDMIDVPPFEHKSKAKELLEKLGKTTGFRGTPNELLTQLGYIRAAFCVETNTLLLDAHVPPNSPLRPAIKRAVKDYAIENNINAAYTITDREGRQRHESIHTIR